MLRLPTLNYFSAQTDTLNLQYQSMYQLNMQMSSGVKYQNSSDDIADSSQATPLSDHIQLLNSYSANLKMAKAETTLASTAMQGVNALLPKIKAAILQAQSPDLSGAQKTDIATSMQGYLNQLLASANTQDSNGQYVFSGSNSSAQTYAYVNGAYQYQGGPNATQISLSPTDQVVQYDVGYNIFGNIPAGNGTFTATANAANTGSAYTGAGSVTDVTSYVSDTYTISFSLDGSGNTLYSVSGASSGVVVPPTAYKAGSTIKFNGIAINISGAPNVGDTFTLQPSGKQDLFTTVQQAINVMNSSTSTPAQLAQYLQTLNQVSAGIDQATGSLSNYMSSVGIRSSTIDSIAATSATFIDNDQKALSTLTSTDYAAASSQLAQTTVALQATQLTYAKIQSVLIQLLQSGF